MMNSLEQKTDNRASSKNNLSEFIDLKFPVHIDGGWGWIVVFASFMILLICKLYKLFLNYQPYIN